MVSISEQHVQQRANTTTQPHILISRIAVDLKLEPMSGKNGEENEVIDVEDSDDDEDPIEEEQLEEYQEMVEQLGNFPVSSP